MLLISVIAAAQTVDEIQEVAVLIDSKIRVAADRDVHGQAEYFQSPEETLARRTGDCDDCAILLLQAVWEAWGIEGRLAWGPTPSGEGHYFVEIHGWYFDPRNAAWGPSRTPPYPVKWIRPFAQVAQYYGGI
jgi:transglutaminase-like putative cysteine protease